MGFWSNFWNRLRGRPTRKLRILLIGLDNSGKSTILQRMKPKNTQISNIAPTVGASMETFNKNKIQFTAYDMSGQGKYRDLWETYYPQTDAIIFVLDASDQVRFGVAQSEFLGVFQHPAIASRSQVAVLVLANKADLSDAVGPMECSDVLQLNSITNRPWTIMQTCALTGQGIEEGLNWLSSVIR